MNDIEITLKKFEITPLWLQCRLFEPGVNPAGKVSENDWICVFSFPKTALLDWIMSLMWRRRPCHWTARSPPRPPLTARPPSCPCHPIQKQAWRLLACLRQDSKRHGAVEAIWHIYTMYYIPGMYLVFTWHIHLINKACFLWNLTEAMCPASVLSCICGFWVMAAVLSFLSPWQT